MRPFTPASGQGARTQRPDVAAARPTLTIVTLAFRQAEFTSNQMSRCSPSPQGMLPTESSLLHLSAATCLVPAVKTYHLN